MSSKKALSATFPEFFPSQFLPQGNWSAFRASFTEYKYEVLHLLNGPRLRANCWVAPQRNNRFWCSEMSVEVSARGAVCGSPAESGFSRTDGLLLLAFRSKVVTLWSTLAITVGIEQREQGIRTSTGADVIRVVGPKSFRVEKVREEDGHHIHGWTSWRQVSWFAACPARGVFVSLTPGLMGLERHLGQHPASSSEDPPAQCNTKKGSRTPNPIASTPLGSGTKWYQYWSNVMGGTTRETTIHVHGSASTHVITNPALLEICATLQQGGTDRRFATKGQKRTK
ncbi:hypothetical protein DFH08DRAFT_807385 [Mycena albidolilacea]|uniref:Uncharacterized protein n=1 Tax=Mycena albidolilacea TaxID=1033008 RepID=A0AAD7A5T9_9AGAR|nr:hypothetical protein DFH08DRAFT_828379 [Mycena albidolilacea]KAJ7350063.1 hypothetical protein DFH08DRAFT_807385 [Mycena albidolilacea]